MGRPRGLAVLLLLGGLLVWRSNGHLPDDAFIFFRYARNLVDQGTWAYNPGIDSLNGATSPLWAVTLAVAYSITGGHIVGAATAIYLCALSGAGTVAVRMFRELGFGSTGYVVALMLITNPIFLAVRGMETGLVILLSVLVLHAATRDDAPWWEGLAAGLLVLCRPEGVILVALTYAHRWLISRRFPTGSVVLGVVTVAPWLVISTVLWGSPVSETLSAKTAQGASGFWGSGFIFFRDFTIILSHGWPLLLLVLAGVGFVDGVRQSHLRSLTLLITGYSIVHFFAYGLIIRPPGYDWYYAITLFGMTVLAGIGIAGTATRLQRDFAGRALTWSTQRDVAMVAAGVLTIGVLGPQLVGQERGNVYAGYAEVGRWLSANSEVDQSVAASEIGVLGWEADRPVVDYLGLLDAQVAEELGRGDLATWIGREQPDYYVAHVPIWPMERPSTSQPWFARAYEPVFETTRMGERSHVRVYQRRRSVDDASGPNVSNLLISDHLVASLDRPGVQLNEQDLEALGLLAGNEHLQQAVETPEGANLGVLATRVGSPGDQRPEDDRGDGLARKLDGVVIPLAPRSW